MTQWKNSEKIVTNITETANEALGKQKVNINYQKHKKPA